ncbi:Gag-Pol polyprotein [Plecturocebus cupreus]
MSETWCILPVEKIIPHKSEALQGIQPLLFKFLKHGLIKSCLSPCNIPILPVKKPNGEYHLVWSLLVVNETVIPIHPMFPNLYILLIQIPRDDQYYTVLDLKDAFFCMHLYSESQYSFAFERRNPNTQNPTQYTLTIGKSSESLKPEARIFSEVSGLFLKIIRSSHKGIAYFTEGSSSLCFLYCIKAIEQTYSSRPELQDKPLNNPEAEHYTYESSSDCLNQVLKLGESKRLNLYTDSKYEFFRIHTHTAIWKESGKLTAKSPKSRTKI